MNLASGLIQKTLIDGISATTKRSLMMFKRRIRKRAIKAGFRSGLEQDNAKFMDDLGVEYTYEKERIPYIPKPKTYTPDFRLSNGIYIETKGRFVSSDRVKHLLIKEQRPELDIRFVFSNSGQKLSKKSKTTYAVWCDKHGFQYADKKIPVKWTKEPSK